MADTIQRVEYFLRAGCPTRRGEGARFPDGAPGGTGQYQSSRVLRLPPKERGSQLDFVSCRSSRLQAVRADGQMEAHRPQGAPS